MCATPKKSKVAPIESDSYVVREYGAGPAAAQLPAKAISTLAGDASHIHYAKASYRWAGAKVAAANAAWRPEPVKLDEWPVIAAFVKDPDGYLVEILETFGEATKVSGSMAPKD